MFTVDDRSICDTTSLKNIVINVTCIAQAMQHYQTRLPTDTPHPSASSTFLGTWCGGSSLEIEAGRCAQKATISRSPQCRPHLVLLPIPARGLPAGDRMLTQGEKKGAPAH